MSSPVPPAPIVAPDGSASSAKRTLAIAAFAFVLAYACLVAVQPIWDTDVWWHLRVGEWIVQHHAVPRTDLFSSVTPDRGWRTFNWLFEVLIYGALRIVGDGLNVTSSSVDFQAPDGLALGPDGSLYISDSAAHVIRRVTPDGIINRIAGLNASGAGSPASEGSAPAAVKINKPAALAMGPDGALYFAELGFNCVRRIRFGTAFTSGTEKLVPSADGKEVWFFDSLGRHVRTVDALTSLVIRQFTYDTTFAGRLRYVDEILDRTTTPVTVDRTELTYDGFGNLTAIIPPRGGQTTIGASGYITSIANPNSETYTFDYTGSGGLLHHFIDPKSQSHELTYDANGALLKDAEPTAAGGWKTLTPILLPTAWSTAITTAMGRVTNKKITLTGGVDARESTDPAGLKTTTTRGVDGTITVTRPNTSSSVTTVTGDPRFQSAVIHPLQLTSTVMPSGLAYSVATSATASFSSTANNADPQNLATFTTSKVYSATSLTSQTYTTTYTRSSNTIVDTLPNGATITKTLDANGRVATLQLPGRNLINYVYDSLGRRTMTWSADPSVTGCGDPAATPSSATGCRRYITTYDATTGFVSSLIDGIGNPTTITATDLVGRPTTVAVPSLDGTPTTRTLGMAFDLNGNLQTVTTPKLIGTSPANPHTFAFDPIDRPTTYTAPDIYPAYPTIARASTVHYNADGQPDLITPPAGPAVHLNYEGGATFPTPNTGRLKQIAYGSTAINFSYGAGSPSSTK